MYYNGQVVHNLDTNKPIKVGKPADGMWAWSMPKARTKPYIDSFTNRIVCCLSPRTAASLLKTGRIRIDTTA